MWSGRRREEPFKGRQPCHSDLWILEFASPPPPRNVMVFPVSPTKVSLKWKAPCNKHCGMEYKIDIFSHEEGEESKIVQRTSRTKSLLFKLKPNTSYKLSISSRNKFGYSLPIIQHVETPSTGVPSAPYGLSYTMVRISKKTQSGKNVYTFPLVEKKNTRRANTAFA